MCMISLSSYMDQNTQFDFVTRSNISRVLEQQSSLSFPHTESASMASSSASKELLELENRNLSFSEAKLLVCNKEASLRRNQGKKKKRQTDGNVDGRPSTAAVPKSQVLGKVKDFLGIMAEANRQLELDVQDNPHSNYDIEVLSGNETEYIEMDLLLGVADLQTPDAVAAAEAAIGSSQPSLPCSAGIGSSDKEESSSDDDSDNENNDSSTCCGKKSKPDDCLDADKLNKHPKIVVL